MSYENENNQDYDLEVIDLDGDGKSSPDTESDFVRRYDDSDEAKKNRKSKKKKANDEPVNWGREILSFAIYIAVAIVLTFLILTYVGQRTVVVGSSMEATLSNDESIIVDKISYRFNDPQRFDIIVFPYQHAKDTYYIKRIIGLPGEKVQIKGSDIYINGQILEESYGLEKINSAGVAEKEITLGADEYFVMGDNRNNSSDSRDPMVGNIKRDSIIGRAWLRIWPFDKITFIKHQ